MFLLKSRLNFLQDRIGSVNIGLRHDLELNGETNQMVAKSINVCVRWETISSVKIQWEVVVSFQIDVGRASI